MSFALTLIRRLTKFILLSSSSQEKAIDHCPVCNKFLHNRDLIFSLSLLLSRLNKINSTNISLQIMSSKPLIILTLLDFLYLAQLFLKPWWPRLNNILDITSEALTWIIIFHILYTGILFIYFTGSHCKFMFHFWLTPA